MYLILPNNRCNGTSRKEIEKKREKQGFFGQKDPPPKNELAAGGVRKWGLGGLGGGEREHFTVCIPSPNLLWVGGFDWGKRDEDKWMLCLGG